MTASYELSFPTKIVFGEKTIAKLATELPPNSKVLLVTGGSALKNGLKDKLLSILAGFETSCVAGVAAEPPLEDVDRIILAGRQFQATAVAAVGGGSVMDAAKAAATLIPAGGFTADYFSGAKSIPGKGLFFIAAPTTAGTGAELTKNSVLTDAKSKVKKSLRHPAMLANVALVDPELTFSCPPEQTAASGLDAFVQAFEGFTNPKANAATSALAAQATAKIAASLERAFKSPNDRQARTEMAEGSMLSAMAFSQTGLGAIHGLAHPVGSLLGVPHGVACAVLMKPVMEWNMPACDQAYASLAKACGGKTAKDFLALATELAEKLNVPSAFRDYSLKREHFAFIVKNCRSASMSLNPRPMSDAEVEALLEKLL